MLRFVVALPAEAKPLIRRYGLAHDPVSEPFRLFRGGGDADRDADGNEVALIVSGIGKIAAASATSYLHLAAGGGLAAWLNVGLAGHGSRGVGEAILAHAVTDVASGRSWYPPRVLDAPVPSDRLLTVDTVERGFAADGAYEMEASGFVSTACRFATSELVHCLKIVSDGPGDQPEKTLSARRAEELVEGRMEEVEAVGESLRGLLRELRERAVDPPELRELLEIWRFTVTEKLQLRRLLERRAVLVPEEPLPRFTDLRRGKDVLRRLRAWLDDLPIAL